VLVFGNATGLCDELRATIGERLLFGFPAAAGARDGTTVRYGLIRQQKTMLGEPDGRATSRVRELRDLLRDAGFSATISSNPSGWLNAHTAFVIPIVYALYRFDTDPAKLADARPSRAAPEGMASLAGVLLATVRLSKRPSPDLDDLLRLTSGSFSRPRDAGY
jgi:2-dehydropantoate 2-reductase